MVFVLFAAGAVVVGVIPAGHSVPGVLLLGGYCVVSLLVGYFVHSSRISAIDHELASLTGKPPERGWFSQLSDGFGQGLAQEAASQGDFVVAAVGLGISLVSSLFSEDPNQERIKELQEQRKSQQSSFQGYVVGMAVVCLIVWAVRT